MSNVGLAGMLSILGYIGPSTVARYYLVPYLVSALLLQLSATHPTTSCSTTGMCLHNAASRFAEACREIPVIRIGKLGPLVVDAHLTNNILSLVMFTYLHHSDPTIPHYRKAEWSFLRGAAATVDRPLLGWMGRFFFHNISHDHVAHRELSEICSLDHALDHLRHRQTSSSGLPFVSGWPRFLSAELIVQLYGR
jgi:hypothetical protein